MAKHKGTEVQTSSNGYTIYAKFDRRGDWDSWFLEPEDSPLDALEGDDGSDLYDTLRSLGFGDDKAMSLVNDLEDVAVIKLSL
jgi:hypothetical protein